jgi:hypothetical protein
MQRPTLTRPRIVDVVGAFVLLAISAALVAVAVVVAGRPPRHKSARGRS